MSLLGAIDRTLRLLFPEGVLPPGMFDDYYWVGLVSGIAVGLVTMMMAVEPPADVDPTYLGLMIAAVATLRFITWRLDQ